MFEGHVIDGGVLSFTVTVNVHDAVLLATSVTVQVTVVTPLLKVDPEAGTHTTVWPGQLSAPVGVV
jgi:hypothetical protein